MKNLVLSASLLALLGCQNVEHGDNSSGTIQSDTELNKNEIEPVVSQGWDSVVISVPDLDEFARIFIELGNYETVERYNQNLILRAPGTKDGYIHLWENLNPNAEPARPLDSNAWDTGCYWSLMMRAKNIPSIIEDARQLGWEPHTELAYLEFGPSKLNIVVLRHQVTGAQIQLYERLTTPLPEGFPKFKRISRPFNIMQMVNDRDVTYNFFQQKLGFETFYYGEPYVSPEPAVMPLGIPKELTTKVPYKAAIVYPEAGMEWGRFEMIEIDGKKHGLMGRDFSDRCNRDNWGVLEVHYKVKIPFDVSKELKNRGQDMFILREVKSTAYAATEYWYRSPDNAAIIFKNK